MKPRRILALIAPLLNLAGALLLFLSLQSTSDTFRFVSVDDYSMNSGAFAKGQTTYALCVNDHVLTETDSFGDLTLSTRSCPTEKRAQAAAIVMASYPVLQYLGLVLSVVGFGIQAALAYLACAERKTDDNPAKV